MSAQHDLPVRPPPRRTGPGAGVQLAASAAVGVAAGIPAAALAGWHLAPLLCWDFACVAYLLVVWLRIWPRTAEQTAELAVSEDPKRGVSDLLTLGAAIASLVAVGFVLGRAGNEHGAAKILLGVLGLASVALSWAVVHTVYALGYARLYYADADGGIDFKSDDRPRYSDFAYLAFTIGMTFQVSDTELQGNVMRRMALRHALLSYLFGTGILASAINLAVNLSK
ncbi:MAG: DUF1345 domain-containing protein [Thermoleophilaceae bacterium]